MLKKKTCREKIKTHIYVQFVFFFFEIRALYEIMWKNMADSDRSQTTIKYGACALHAG